MKRPRISIAGLMGASAIIALEFAALRPMYPSEDTGADYAVGLLPMAGILAFGLMIMARELVRCGETGSFLVGFEAFGAAAMIAFLFVSALFPGRVDDCVDLILESMSGIVQPTTYEVAVDTSGMTHTSIHANYFADVLLQSALALWFTLPQLAFAGFGGWLSRILGIRIISGRRQEAIVGSPL